MRKTHKYERTLTDSQLTVLTMLYSLRFSTRSLLSESLGKPNNTSFYVKLQVLEKHGYIMRRYDTSYKLAGREAEYFITLKGLRVLHDTERVAVVTDAMQSAVYKDKLRSDSFVKEQILLGRLRNTLLAAHPDTQYFTARDIQLLDYFPETRPAAFVSNKTPRGINRFFVEYVPLGAHTTKLKYRLKYYMTYYDSNEWGVTDTPFPSILYICEDGMTEKGVRRHIKLALYKADTDIQFYTTTQKALLAIRKDDTAIWSDVIEPEVLHSLDTLIHSL